MNLSHYPQTPLANYENTLVHLLRPFPAVRFMNWQQINRKSASERTLICEHSDMPTCANDDDSWEYTGGPWAEFSGVPIERMVRVANLTESRPWICVPVAASDDLMAHIIEHAVADADFVPVIEFANEIWNNHFWQHQYAAEQGMNLKLGNDKLTAALAWQARQTIKLAEMAGDSAEITIGAQFFNTAVARTLLKHTGSAISSLAVAPYLGRNQNSLANGQPRPLATIHAEVRDEINGDVADHIHQYKTLCDKVGVKLVAYEGGLHQVARNWDPAKKTTLSKPIFEASKQAFLDYNRSRFAADNTAHLWQTWRENGGGLFCPYSLATTYQNIWNGDTQNQYFGHCELLGKEIRILPKFHAAKRMASQLPAPARTSRATGRGRGRVQ